ncbi:hypothetical protein KF728_17640 [Candidatus Obscuribacterales bacterium]|nr:hypothetical protein [Candidatus Obscuribacterales bacterium]
MATETAEPVTAENFHKLPRGSQLLIAYALFNDVWKIQLLRTDRDILALLNSGWLVAKPSGAHGFVNGVFEDSTWAAFETIEDKILGSVTDGEMERFVARKGKEYPWLW